MRVENKLHPEPEQMEAFLATEGPVCLVNLLKFREKAAYPDGRDPELSGREAFMRYATAMTRLVEAAGGRFRFDGEVLGALIGEIEESWHLVGIAEYPSAKALVELSATPEFREIELHRNAGLAGQLNLVTRAVGAGRGLP